MTDTDAREHDPRPTPPSGSAWENRITGIGAVGALLGLLTLIASIMMETLSPAGNPYRGIWSFMVVPTLLVTALLIIPLGWYLERRRRSKLYPEIHDWQRFP